MHTSEVLYTAADLIDFHGHTTGSGWPGSANFTGPLCLEGGIMAALDIDWEHNGDAGLYVMWACPAYKAVKSYLTGPMNPKGEPPFMWQDHLKYVQDAEGNILYRYVGGSESAASAYAHEQVTSVLRATAVIEAAKEQAASDLADALDVAPVGVRA